MLSITDPFSPTGTFVDGQRLEKKGKAELVPGKSTVTIGRCPAQYVLHLDSNGLEHNGQTDNVTGTLSSLCFCLLCLGWPPVSACMHDAQHCGSY